MNLQKKEALAHLTSLSDWLRWVFSCLNQADIYLGHGIDSCWDEALQLVLSALSLPLDPDELVYQATLLPHEREKIIDYLDRRVNKREPLAYIIKKAWFMGMPFYVDSRVLIPRSPFGEWIERAFSPWVDADKITSICDIGTGSGCIAIASAAVFDNASVDAIDISSDALAVAKHNVDEYGLADRVNLIESDGLSAVGDRVYDLIISNPPYVPNEEQASLPEEYCHEPESALFAGNNGMQVVESLLRGATKHLSDHGMLFVEVGQYGDNIIALFPELPFTWLSCSQGGEGIFMLTKKDLQKAGY